VMTVSSAWGAVMISKAPLPTSATTAADTVCTYHYLNVT
jgi:hypothetical protein